MCLDSLPSTTWPMPTSQSVPEIVPSARESTATRSRLGTTTRFNERDFCVRAEALDFFIVGSPGDAGFHRAADLGRYAYRDQARRDDDFRRASGSIRSVRVSASPLAMCSRTDSPPTSHAQPCAEANSGWLVARRPLEISCSWVVRAVALQSQQLIKQFTAQVHNFPCSFLISNSYPIVSRPSSAA